MEVLLGDTFKKAMESKMLTIARLEDQD
uniref:Uncharacterized protein n=1 Tax=Arundo donax TaxID=35708 RepID=A0A0A9C183_ARUDO